jgi:hypothetical protein
VAGWWGRGRPQHQNSLHLSTTCRVLQVRYRGVVGDLWYTVATQGMGEGRRPGFEPQSEGEKKKSSRGSARGKNKKAQGGVQQCKLQTRLKEEYKRANNTSKQHQKAQGGVQKSPKAQRGSANPEKAQGGVQILKRLKVECRS